MLLEFIVTFRMVFIKMELILNTSGCDQAHRKANEYQ